MTSLLFSPVVSQASKKAAEEAEKSLDNTLVDVSEYFTDHIIEVHRRINNCASKAELVGYATIEEVESSIILGKNIGKLCSDMIDGYKQKLQVSSDYTALGRRATE